MPIDPPCEADLIEMLDRLSSPTAITVSRIISERATTRANPRLGEVDAEIFMGCVRDSATKGPRAGARMGWTGKSLSDEKA